jgi:hypothetical protein
VIARTSTAPPLSVTHVRLAAFLLLVLTPLPVFGMVYVPSVVIVPGDIATTARNILASESLFRLGIASTLLGHLVSDIFWPLVLYQVFKPVNRNAATLMVIFSLIGLPISLLNELNQFAVLALLHGPDRATVLSSDQLQALVSLFLNLHDAGTKIAQIFWGLWLFPYGYLVYQSGFLPSIMGVLLMVGCFGYLLPAFAEMLSPGLEASIGLLPAISSLGELLVPLWLMIRGVNAEQWGKRALASV